MSAGRPLRHQLSAVYAGAGTQVHHVVRLADRLLVVLDHDNRVAEVAQLLESCEQPPVVALVQSDGRLIENVHDAGETRADLAGEADTLGFAARERLGAAIERQVIESHVGEEAQSLDHSLDDACGDFAAPARDGQLREELERAPDGQMRHLRQTAAGDEHEARRAVQSRALALRARAHPQVARELLAHHRRLRFTVAPCQVGNDALEGMALARALPGRLTVAELDGLLAAAAEQDVARVLRQLGPGSLDVEAIVFGERLDQMEVMLVAPVPAAHRSAGERQVRMHHDALRIEELLHPEAVAAGAGAGRVVEGEQLRFQRRHAVAAHRAGMAAGEYQRLALGRIEEHQARQAACEPQRGLEGLRQALRGVGANAHAIHHHLDAVLLFRIEPGKPLHLVNAPVDTHAHVTLRGEVFEDLQVLALARSHHRRDQRRGRAFGQAQHLVHHLAHGLRGQLDAVIGAAWDTGTCV